MVKFKRNLLSVALASATLMAVTGAHAQSVEAGTTAAEEADQASQSEADDATNLDAVVVTGIRAGIESAIETKKNATSIVESISAEDIGKLPDVSIAESLARLPGL
ncbi:MAG: TonB-dependent receptor, partial [Lysobacter sp.]